MVESTRWGWITEMLELKGMHRSMLQDIKQYFTSEFDTVRLAYRRNEEHFYRRNVTIGTTNEDEYLREGENRRFCPVPVGVNLDDVLDFDTFLPLVPQIWAEAEQIFLEMRRKQPKGHLPLNFQSPEAKAEARERQTLARETLIHEPVAEVLQEWLDQPYSPEAVAAGDALVDEFEGDDGDQVFVRNYVTTTMLRQALGANPIIRDLKMAPDKVINAALRTLDGWENLGNVRRLNRRARWWCRIDNDEEFLPLETIRPQAVPEEPDVDDLLG